MMLVKANWRLPSGVKTELFRVCAFGFAGRLSVAGDVYFPCDGVIFSVDMFSLRKLSISCGQNIVVARNPHVKCR